jgi:peroxiredoxin Q/BCP
LTHETAQLTGVRIAFLAAAMVSAAEPLKVGDTAPDFTMVGSDGKTYKLSELTKAGKAVVVAWYPRAFTGGCTKECASFKEQGGKIREFDVAYFTASNDPAEKNKEFAVSLNADYPILSDSDSSVAKYGILNDKGTAACGGRSTSGPTARFCTSTRPSRPNRTAPTSPSSSASSG